MLNVFNVNPPGLKWLHYTIWMALYPLAFLCEGTLHNLKRGFLMRSKTRGYLLAMHSVLRGNTKVFRRIA